MFERVRSSKVISPEGFGALLVLVGLVMFVVIFFMVVSVLTDPVKAYDKWFPEDAEPVLDADSTDPDESAAEPTAAFRFVVESTVDPVPEGTEAEEPIVTYAAIFEDRSEAGDEEIVSWTWDLGDGNEALGPSAAHFFGGPGVYSVLLTIEDANGLTSKVEADVEVPEEGRSFDRVDAGDDIDLSRIETAVEDALDSVVTTTRSTSVVVLFALAAIATTVVAWRVTRSGVMLLRPTPEMRLKVKSANMHVDVGKTTMEEAIAQQLSEDLVDLDRDPDLVEL